MLIYVFWGAPLLGLTFGEFYAAGGVVLVVLGLGQLVSALAGSCAQLLFMTGHQRVSLAITLAAVCLGLVLARLMVERYGMIGVAGSFSVAVALQNIAMVAYGWRTLGIKTFVGLPARMAGKRRGRAP